MKDNFLETTNTLLEEHYQQNNFDLHKLCQLLGISRVQLHRKLVKACGQSATNYIRSFRLHKAKILLEQTDLRVSEIAYQTGFGNITYFSASFLKEFGCTPVAIRKDL